MSDKKSKVSIVTGDIDVGMAQRDVLSQIFDALRKSKNDETVKLAFTEDPNQQNRLANIFKPRSNLIPTVILKRIRDTEELVGGIIIPTRAKQISLFGRPRPNRFDIGFECNIKPEVYKTYSDEQIEEIKATVIPKLREFIINCGKNDSLIDKDKMTFSQYLHCITEDMMLYGWFSTEIIRDADEQFHSFRPRDAGTMYFALPGDQKDREIESIMASAVRDLSNIQGKDLQMEFDPTVDYTWVQSLDGSRPYMAFTDKQMLMWSLNPSTDIQRAGYPVSPLERILSSIDTQINLTTHNRMFFVNGRAAKNVMVFKADNMDTDDLRNIRAQMQGQINSSNSAFRMPVFQIGLQDDIEIKPLESGNRDAEFTYLSDLNKRMIFAAFQLSPDEIASLSYLSKGTNSQALAESNNEWKLLKSQEIGLRPILNNLEDFINERLLPQINIEWSKLVTVNFAGLDANSPEKENAILQGDAALFLSMNDIMSRVEKESVPLGGKLPLNQAYFQLIGQLFTYGEIMEAFEPERYKDASKKPEYQYYINNPSWFQFQQLQMQSQQMQQQAQMSQQQMQQPQQPGQPNQPPQDGQQPGQDPNQQVDPSQGQQPDMQSAIAQLQESLGKSEIAFSKTVNLSKLHDKIRKNIIKDFEKDSKHAFEKVKANAQLKKP